MAISVKDFGASFKGFLDQVSAAAPAEDPVFRRRLREHFAEEPDKLPILTEKFPPYDHANLHIAVESALSGPDCSVEMFELLNQMDGLADDADVLFLLTTNRPDILEPALAARPGRVDHAFEIPLPDAACRRRLIALYAQGLTLGSVNLESCVQRTEGASAAFIREMLRKAALFAADEESDRIEDQHLEEAIHELVVEGGALTRSLLGFASRPSATEGDS